MAGHASKQIDAKTLWGGKMSPLSTSYGKLYMWFFLVSDALTFTGLLLSYAFTRHDYLGSWPIGEQTFNSMPFLGHGYPLLYVALMTFILIISSVTMVLAVEAGHRMDKRGVVKWMIATIIGGFFFVIDSLTCIQFCLLTLVLIKYLLKIFHALFDSHAVALVVPPNVCQYPK